MKVPSDNDWKAERLVDRLAATVQFLPVIGSFAAPQEPFACLLD